MGKLIIYGASDDLIEIEGDVRGEFPAADGLGQIALSDGSVLAFSYGDKGIWRFSVVKKTKGTTVKIKPCPDPEGDEEYSDRVTMTGPEFFEWAMVGQIAYRVKPPTGKRKKR